jgi:hypothetical protein
MILHDFYTILAIIIGAGFIGVLLFGNNNNNKNKNQRDSAANILKYISLIATISVFAIVITGTIGYIEYRLPQIDSAKSIIIRTFPFTHMLCLKQWNMRD